MFARSFLGRCGARVFAATLIFSAATGLGAWPADAETRLKARGATVVASSKSPAAKPDVQPKGPLVISISLASQHLTVFDGTEPIATSRISSGKIGHSTPTGVYSVIEKNRIHHSNIYSGAPMPFMQRITWSGIALHAGVVPGYPASHGCVRLPAGFSEKLFGMTRVGTRVIISRDLKVPEIFTHEWLAAVSGPEVLVSGADGQTGGERRPTPRERRAAEIAKITTDVREAGYALAGLRAGLERVSREAEAKRNFYQEKRQDLARLETLWRKASVAREAAKKDLDTFTRPRLARLDTGVVNDATPQETEQQTTLESRFSEAADAADDAEFSFKSALEAFTHIEADYQSAVDARQAVLADIDAARATLDAAKDAEVAFKRREAKRAQPVSVLISRVKGKLYVRLGWEEIFEVPVTFERPDEFVGTHVFTALAPDEGSPGVRWSVVTIETPKAKSSKERRDREAKAKPEPEVEAPPKPQTADAALKRVSIPIEAREEIADLMKPGSSIIISDFGLGTETGEYTDFIVQTRQ